MTRRVAVLGLALSVVGGLLMVWGQPPPAVAPTVPVDNVTNIALALLPTIGSLLASVGGMTIAFAVLLKVTGRSPVVGRLPVLLGTGLALVLVSMLGQLGLVSSLMNVDQMRTALAVISGAALAHTVGAALLSLWLMGLLTARVPVAHRPLEARDHASR